MTVSWIYVGNAGVVLADSVRSAALTPLDTEGD